MKKNITIIILSTLLISISSCTGYKPIFGSSNLQFEISDYSIEGDKKLGNKIYSKLYVLDKENKNNPSARSVVISIKTNKDKIATAKNSAGKILEYKISLNTNIIIKDYLTNDKILNHNFKYSSSYKVQDQHSETVKIEEKTLRDLLDRIFEDLLIKMSENIMLK